VDVNYGWELLRKGDYGGAIAYFQERLDSSEADFSDYWGLGRAYLLTGERNEAVRYLEAALTHAVQAWEKGEIPYELAETIEKDLDRVTGQAEVRILKRSRDYLFGLLRLTGAMGLRDAVEVVEQCAYLRLTPVWDSLLEELRQDTRFRIHGEDIIQLPEVEDGSYLIASRRNFQVSLAYTLDDLVKSWRGDNWRELELGLEPVLDGITGGNLKPRALMLEMLNSKTFREALDRISIRTRLYDLRSLLENWYRLLFQLWVTIPRWELGFKSLEEAGVEDLWLGQVTSREVAAVLGLDVDEEGNFYCRECGERVALRNIHQHGT